MVQIRCCLIKTIVLNKMFILHTLLNLTTIISAILLYTTTHPIYSVLLLVLLFCEAAITLFIFNIEFLSLTLIVVYVGAIAVLFLFVVMMLNIKTLQHNILKKIKYFGLMTIILLLGLFSFFKDLITNFNLFTLNSVVNFDINYFGTLNNLEVIGQLLLNEYSLCLFIVGLLLLVPLLGSIVLTLDCNTIANNFVTIRQLSRTPNTLAFFK